MYFHKDLSVDETLSEMCDVVARNPIKRRKLCKELQAFSPNAGKDSLWRPRRQGWRCMPPVTYACILPHPRHLSTQLKFPHIPHWHGKARQDTAQAFADFPQLFIFLFGESYTDNDHLGKRES